MGQHLLPRAPGRHEGAADVDMGELGGQEGGGATPGDEERGVDVEGRGAQLPLLEELGGIGVEDERVRHSLRQGGGRQS